MPRLGTRALRITMATIIVATALTAATAALTVASGSVAGAAVVFGTAAEIPGSPGGQGYLQGVSCTGAGACTAVGIDSNGRPIYIAETGGVWGTPTAVPTGALGGVGVFNGVSCTSVGGCTAVGDDGSDTNGHANGQPIHVTESGGVWGTPTELPVSSGGVGTFNGVSCTTVGECTAVGHDGSGNADGQPIYVTQTGGVWGTPTEVPVQPGGYGGFFGVSCTAVGDCTAIGFDSKATGPIYATESGGVWGTPTTLPAGAPAQSSFDSVSCTEVGACTAVEIGFSPNGPTFATETGGVWGTVAELPGSLGGGGVFTGVSCTGIGMCTAVGYDFHHQHEPIVATETGRTY